MSFGNGGTNVDPTGIITYQSILQEQMQVYIIKLTLKLLMIEVLII